ncbi:MAG: DUF2341 domain-containing protein [Chitinispirillaceae bacterium]
MVSIIRSVITFFTPMFLLLFCSSPYEVTGGGSSETVIGVVMDEDGAPSNRAVVNIYPQNYNPVRDSVKLNFDSDTTDENGRYQLTPPAHESYYSIVATHSSSQTRALICSVEVNGDSTCAPTATLSKPGVVLVAEPDNADKDIGYVYIPGTDACAYIHNESGSVSIENVPSGRIPAVIYSSLRAPENETVLSTGIFVFSNDTVTLALTDWPFQKKIYLNTTETGAHTTENVTNFPVLVTLTDTTFRFSQSKADGSDIRFTNKAGLPVPFQIERWDSDIERAEIWVRVDTVLSNTSDHITMHWGNREAQSVSCDSCTFGTRFGWAGVWHLSEDAPFSGTPDLYRNSSRNINHGDDNVRSEIKNGYIGKGQHLDKDQGDVIAVFHATPELQPSHITLTAWVQVNSIDPSGGEIASMGDNFLLRVDENGTLRFIMYSQFSKAECVDSSMRYDDSLWHFLAATYDGQEARLYVDGELKSTVPFTEQIFYGKSTDFIMGGHGMHSWGYNLGGSLDEITLSSVARSDEWIRLTYNNQHESGRLVHFGE